MFTVAQLLASTQGRLISGRKNCRATGISIDTRTLKQGEAFIALKGTNFDGHDFLREAAVKGAGVLIVQQQECRAQLKGYRGAVIKVRDTIVALGRIAHFHRRRFSIPVIAVTGSNGKTTTKELIAGILQKRLRVLKNEGTKNNHIGLPMALLGLRGDHQVAVVEAGTNHFGEVEYLAKICQPTIAVITTIGPAHLAYLKNLTGVFREKYSLLTHLRPPHLAVLNADDRFLAKVIRGKSRRPVAIGFGTLRRCEFRATGISQVGNQLQFTVNTLYQCRLNGLGMHNVYNALAAIAVSRLLGMTYEDICSQLAGCVLPTGRMQLIEVNRIKVIDDTYNANPLSLAGALETLERFKTTGRKIFIMGDMCELGSNEQQFHLQAGRLAAGACDVLVTVGDYARLAAQAARARGFDPACLYSCSSTAEARQVLFESLRPTDSDVILVKGSRAMRMEEVFKDR